MRPNKPDFRYVFTAVKWVRLIFLRDFCSKSYMSYSLLISDSLCSLTVYVYVTLHGNKVVRGLGMVIREPLYCGVYFQKSVQSREQVWGIGQLCGRSQLPVMTIRTWHSTDCGEMVTDWFQLRSPADPTLDKNALCYEEWVSSRARVLLES